MSVTHPTPAPAGAPASLFLRAAGATLVSAGLLLSPCSAAPALTLPEAQRLALQRSRQLAAHDSSLDAARQMAVAAGQLPDPVLKAGIDNLPVSGADRFSLGQDFMTMRRIGISQELTGADKRRRRAALYEQEGAKALAAKRATAAGIERETAWAWLELHFAIKAERLIAAQAIQTRNEVEAAEGAYRGARASLADVSAARMALALAENQATEGSRRRRNATVMLGRWTGTDAGAELAELPPMAHIGLDPATLEATLAGHPDLAVLAQQERIARAEADLADANRKADWNVELAFQQRGQGYSNMVSVGVSVPLQWDRGRRQDRELGAKLALAEAASAEREEALRARLAETQALLGEWESGRERHLRFERDVLPLARQRSVAALAAYRGGKTSLTDVLASRRDELDATLQGLQLQAQTARVWAQLTYLIPSPQADKDIK
ncbi:TolC family protein [Pseudoduganella sp. LjRoot289]|uniref:TolC family protein n=1 Tax=Pseudoduganella sp. LjRoot289 TaxID=3342314 RepID=UPI003ED15042